MKSVRTRPVPKRLVDLINRREARHKGKLVVIEPESGEYFIGDTMMEAFRKARRRYPDRTFVFKRIGYRWTVRQVGGLGKVGR